VAILIFTTLLLAGNARGQAPGMLWSTNVGGTLFALDPQANLYATDGTNVIKVNATGQALATNTFCPLPGLAARDADGNYYFAGTLTGTQDFGGVELSVQFNSICFLAKYSSAGTLLWATNYGPNNIGVGVTDLELDPAGNVYVGHRLWLPSSGGLPGDAYLARFTPGGDVVWDIMFDSDWAQGSLQVNPVSTSNCFAVHYSYGPHSRFLSLLYRVNESGNRTLLPFPMPLSGDQLSAVRFVTEGKPVSDGTGNVYVVVASESTKKLAKFTDQPGGMVWETSISTNPQWALGPDWAGGVYLAGQYFDEVVIHQLSRYDASGQKLWTMTPTSRCAATIADAHGNLFASFDDGTVARVANEAPATRFVSGHYDASGFAFQIQGIVPAYRISTNSGTGDWFEAGIMTNTGGTASFGDPSATSAPMRFYRIEPLP
jgi:hypothetical protein